ncbi:hypothetical protein EJB05_33982, partial [Eragrostis curvula]
MCITHPILYRRSICAASGDLSFRSRQHIHHEQALEHEWKGRSRPEHSSEVISEFATSAPMFSLKLHILQPFLLNISRMF